MEDLARRSLLQGAGALLVGLSLAPKVRAESLGPFARPEITGPSPDPKVIDTWIRIGADNRATLLMGKCDIGQGGSTALRQIAAEELDLGLDQMTHAPLVSGVTPDQGETDASSTVDFAGPEVRAAAAEARLALLTLASTKLGVPVEGLMVERGSVFPKGAPNRSVTYGELLVGQRLSVPVTGKAPLKKVADYKVVGRPQPRTDVAPKVSGRFEFMQTLKVPGMLHGRVVRPPQSTYGRMPEIVSVDERSIAGIGDARVVRRGNFLGVVATREWDAVRAARALKVQWRISGGLPGHERLYEQMRSAPTKDSVIETAGDAAKAFAAAPHKVEGQFRGPYQAHAPFAPHCTIADVKPDRAEIWSISQGVYATRYDVSLVLPHIPLTNIVVRHYEGAGVYGAACYQDVAQGAAILSQAVGRPVRLQFSRGDEFGWDNFGPPHLAEVKVAADAAGKLTAYQYDGWQHSWIQHEASHELAIGVKQPSGPQDRAREVNKLNAGVMYDLPNKQLNNHHISNLDNYLRGNSLRSPVDMAIAFASEQSIDELAVKLGLDPVEFRRRNISNPRWLAVLEAAAKAANWSPRVQGSKLGRDRLARGRGVAMGTHFASHGAAVAEVEVNRETGEIAVHNIYGALDCGLVINPDIVESQIIGMCTQAASRMLKEEVTFDDQGVTSLDWNGYPVIRFDEHPRITPILVQQPNERPTGAGEELMGPTGAAIANAVFDAIGVRFHQFPLTPERVKAALARA